MEVKKIFRQEEVQSVFFIGDLHSDFGVIPYTMNKCAIKNSVFIQVGDFGIGYNLKKELHNLNVVSDLLVKANNYLYVIRGNHDNPACFNNKELLPNIFLLEDYTILTLNLSGKSRNFFCLGGALSVDRKTRQLSNTWFKDESPKFIYDAVVMDEIKDIHCMVTHTAPSFVEPSTFGSIVYHFAKNDKELLADCREERRLMSQFVNCIFEKNTDTLTEYFYGHFHFSAFSVYKGVEMNLLSIGEFKEYKCLDYLSSLEN